MRNAGFGSLALPLILISLTSAVSVAANPLNPVLGPEALCLPALLLAIFSEGAVILVCALIRRKPAGRLVLACTLANCITVTALTVLITVSTLVLRSNLGYAAILIAAGIIIWLFETFFLRRYPGTQVNWKEAFSFSLAMNLSSLAAGYAVVSVFLA